MPRTALVSPLLSVRIVTPGTVHGLCGGGGATATRSISLLSAPAPARLTEGQISVRVVAGVERFAAALPCHPHEADLVVTGGAIDAGLRHTAIAKAIERVALGIDSDFIEVEQIAVTILTAAALLPNAG